MKKCETCKEKKAHVVKCGTGASGRQRNRCTACNTKIVKKYRETPEGRKKINQAVYASMQKYPEKQAARRKVMIAVKKGKLLKPTACSKCKRSVPVLGHHKDYSKPLVVEWLCRTCHAWAHKK